MTDPLTSYQVTEGARFRAVGDEGVFVLLGSSEVLVVNGTATIALTALSRGGSPIEAVVREYRDDAGDLSEEQVRADLTSLFDELVEAGALSVKAAS